MTIPAQDWGRIPLEMRQRRQWVVVGADKVPLVVAPKGLEATSVHANESWHDFNTAAREASSRGLGVGYVLHESDPYSCIDLDVKDSSNEKDPALWTTQEQFDRFWKIIQAFGSYTETSRGGKGCHIWVKGNIGAGLRRDGVEVYSRERHIICTGNVVIDSPILENQALLDILAHELRGQRPAGPDVELIEQEEEYTDEEILELATGAANADKFNALCSGNWIELGYPSQSEADLALMSIFAFYSKSNEQCRRLFRLSGLGKRDKATKNDRHLNYTLKVIRTREEGEKRVQAHGESVAAALVAQLNAQHKASATPLHVPPQVPTVPVAQPVAAAAALSGPTAAPVLVAGESGLQWPPGLAGAIAGFIYQSAPRPVKEVAIVATLGFLAGLCGKAFNIPQSGLNLYLILIARSAVGKEALHSGISALCKAAYNKCPAIMDFVNFSDFASGPALVKEVVAQQSMVNVAGEWGRKLKRMAHDDGRDGALSTLRTVMTNLYQKIRATSHCGRDYVLQQGKQRCVRERGLLQHDWGNYARDVLRKPDGEHDGRRFFVALHNCGVRRRPSAYEQKSGVNSAGVA